jgi:VWFA-related protein
MRRLAGTVLCATALLRGQQPAPTFRAGTRLVEVSVTVLDRKGNPVTDLAAQDFQIQDNGKPRPVAFFRFEGAAENARPAPTLPRGVFTNTVEGAGAAPRNVTALVLDGLNTPPQYNAQARAQVMRYLKAMAPQSRLAIFHMGKALRVLHDFTDDAASLREKIEKARLEIPLESVTDFSDSISEAEQFVDMFAGDPEAQAAMAEMMQTQLEMEMAANAAARRSRMERSLAAMEALGQHLSGISGRKNLVWITGGFSMVAILGAMGMGPRGDVQDFEDQVRATSQRLAQKGITLYIVDAHGIETQRDMSASVRQPLPVRGRGRFEPQMDAEAINNDPFPAMSLMANITGGRYVYNTNDLNTGFKQALADLRGGYTVGFYAADDGDDKWHRLRVRVARPGVNVRHREGYISEKEPGQKPAWTAESWRAAAANPIGSSALPMTVLCQPMTGGEMLLRIQVGAASLHFGDDAGGGMRADLQIMIAGRSADGRIWTNLSEIAAKLPRERMEKLRESVVPVLRRWKPDAATTALRVIVRDRFSGRFGSVDVPLAKLAAR